MDLTDKKNQVFHQELVDDTSDLNMEGGSPEVSLDDQN